MRKTTIFLFAWLLIAGTASAQKFKEHPQDEPRNKGKAILFHLGYGFDLPAGDLADRFGYNSGFSGGLEFFSANNWIAGADANFFFGSIVNEDPLEILRTTDGDIIGRDKSLAQIFMRERGWYAGGHFGKMITFGEKRSGLRLTMGAGWTQHKIKLQDDNQSVTQVTGEYAKGYDRLSGGLALNQFVGWQHLGKLRTTNFIVGFEFNQGFTNTLREWDFSSRKKLDDARIDLRFGIRAIWTLPFYQTKAEEIYY